ncbi:MAG: HRDC domain-containing protein, partial [Saprospiraceae bacterium]|nr:HRDC domain-containing protein [Saprospiraceae bacterium]
ICLIQLAFESGTFIIDPLKVDDLTPLFDILANPDILKITHAGENDYRILYQNYGVLPKNTVDTQVASAFVGYRYPVSYRKLGESELNLRLDKGFTVAKWDQRPLSKKALVYGAKDVEYLIKIWQKLEKKLTSLGRLDWVLEECKFLEDSQSYESDPDKETLESNIIRNISPREQLFLLRLNRWRREEAERKNYSKDMILPNKYIGQLVKTVGGGMDALNSHRRLHKNLIDEYGQLFLSFYENEITPEEKKKLGEITKENTENPKQELLTEMLDQIVKYRCLDEQIAHEIVMPRSILKRMKADADFFDESVSDGWRSKFLGPDIVHWFKNRTRLDLSLLDGKIELKLHPAQ